MNHGISTIIFPVTDIARAKTLYSTFLGVAPDMDEAYYVGFRVAGQDIGLDPNGHNKGMTGPVGYWHVDDIRTSLQLLLDAGAQAEQEVRDVGGGKLIATVKDADGNSIGLLQEPSFFSRKSRVVIRNPDEECVLWWPVCCSARALTPALSRARERVC